MQLFAFDASGRLTFADHAHKQMRYRCPECQGDVCMRAGMQRRAHFYHVDAVHPCRQNGKSPEHLAVQWFIWDALPEGEGRLECSLPEIKRIADVVWLPKKIVYEVQCSPIAAIEVAARNRDYARAGFEVIWVLHDRCYNRRHLSGMELWLHERQHYFTNIDREGHGMIYDQFSQILPLAKRFALGPLPVEISQLKVHSKCDGRQRAAIPQVAARMSNSSYYHTGDLIDLWLQGDQMHPYLQEVFHQQASHPVAVGERLTFFERCRCCLAYLFLRPYWLVLRSLLERCSK